MSEPGPTATGNLAAAGPPPGSVLAERFRIESILGIGGMGVVYRATDLALGVPVAIKLLRPELADRPEAFERFRQELLLARQVSSPRVVRIHDIAHHEGRWLISMDLVEGESLDRVIDREGPLPVEHALRVTRQLAEGLAAAHRCDVIHRDLKPSNVLIDTRGDARIADFGVARSLGTSGLTHSGAIVGTPDYLSPEQARGEPVDARSDLYALGLILYEMLTGRRAFEGSTAAESLSRRMLAPPPPAERLRPDLPAWVARLLHRLLQPRPAHRFADASAVIEAIDRRRVPRDLRPGRRSALAALAAVAVAVLWWGAHRLPVTSSTVVPDRLLVLADPGPAESDPAWSAAVEHLRQGLATLPGLAVVDGERTAQALAQLALPDGVAGDPAAARRLVPAQRLLHLRLLHDADGVRIAGEFEDGRERRPIQGPPAAGTADAVQGFGDALLAALRPRDVFPRRLLPRHEATLADYGRGLAAQRSGQPSLAALAFAEATAREPDYAAAWLALAENALASGQHEQTEAALQRGRASPAPPRLQQDLQVVAGLLGESADAAATTLRQRLAETPDDLSSALRLGQLLGEGGDHAAAAEVLENLLRRDPDDPRAWFLLGKYTLLRGDPRRALDDQLVRALVLYKRSRNAYGEAETVNAMGIGYLRLGQATEAEEQFQRALVLRRELADRRGVAATLRNLAHLATIRGRDEQAETHLSEAAVLYAALGDHAGQAGVDRELGLLAEERGDYPAALEAYRRTLRVNERAGDAWGAADSLNDIGFAHYQLGDYDSARVFWRQAGDAFGDLDDPRGLVRARQNLGLLDIARGQWDAARERLERSLADAERGQMVEEAAVSRRNLAELDIVQGRIGPALAQLERAEALFEAREDRRGLIDAALLRARALLTVGAHAGAAETLAAIEAGIDEASREQRAIAALLRAEMEGASSLARQQALARAREQADAAGLPVLVLHVRALAQDSPGETAAAIARLGHVPLQLFHHRHALEARLHAGDAAGAATEYRSARALLDGRGDYAGAFALHRGGALALSALGEAAEAEDARTEAARSLARLADGLPEALREHLPDAVEVAAAGPGPA